MQMFLIPIEDASKFHWYVSGTFLKHIFERKGAWCSHKIVSETFPKHFDGFQNISYVSSIHIKHVQNVLIQFLTRFRHFSMSPQILVSPTPFLKPIEDVSKSHWIVSATFLLHVFEKIRFWLFTMKCFRNVCMIQKCVSSGVN